MIAPGQSRVAAPKRTRSSNAPDARDAVRLAVVRDGTRWAIRHNGGVLGHAQSFREAESIARMLPREITAEGRSAQLTLEAEH